MGLLSASEFLSEDPGFDPLAGQSEGQVFLGLFFCLEGQVFFWSFFCLEGQVFLVFFVCLEGQVFFFLLSSRLSQLLCRPVCA